MLRDGSASSPLMAIGSDGTPTIEQLRTRLAAIEDTLARSRRKLADAQTLARIGSWEWDVVEDLVWWSDELYRIYALEPRSIEPTYQDFLERVHPDDRESVDVR